MGVLKDAITQIICGFFANLFSEAILSHSKTKDKVVVIEKPVVINNELKMDLQPSEQQPKSNSVYSVVNRFLELFQSHGILITQIQSFVDPKFKLKLDDLKDNESILKILTEELIDWTCNIFGIQKGWIQCDSSSIYPYRNYYKNIHEFVKLLKALKKECQVDMYVLKDGDLNSKDEREQNIIMILRIPIKKFNNRLIYRYLPISTLWNWGYWRSRYQAKAIFFICEKLHIVMKGFNLGKQEIIGISSGHSFPESLLKELPLGYTWYPEDYIDLPSESCCSKDTFETDQVREYIQSEGYLNI